MLTLSILVCIYIYIFIYIYLYIHIYEELAKLQPEAEVAEVACPMC